MRRSHFSWTALLFLALGGAGCDELKPNPDGTSGKPVLAQGEQCGPKMGVACSQGLYCKHEVSQQCGDQGAHGICSPKPLECPDEDSAVCGCDGKTRYSPCAAASDGVSVAHTGRCSNDWPGNAEKGWRCGGVKSIACKEGLICEYPSTAACGKGQVYGTCVQKPKLESCKDDGAPVCGCDAINYPSACHAQARGIAVYATQACGPDAPAKLNQPCGTQGSPASCAMGLFCQFDAKANCGHSSQPGVCAMRPDACHKNYDPVCGCDGHTHGNACIANARGVSIAAKGECVSAGR